MSTAADPLSPRGLRMLTSLWPPVAEDPSTVAAMRSAADELDGIEDLIDTVRTQAWPHLADDRYGLLSLHEALLKVPVRPAGVPLLTRQATVKAAMQARRVGSAENWVKRMNAMMRENPWRYERNTPGRGQLTITIPYGAGSYSGQQVRAFAERVTPAHLEVIIRYEAGWIAGVSQAGVDAV